MHAKLIQLRNVKEKKGSYMLTSYSRLCYT
jgi:hypothetical protein